MLIKKITHVFCFIARIQVENTTLVVLRVFKCGSIFSLNASRVKRLFSHHWDNI